MRAPFIVVTGNIGAGKSTLTEHLSQALSYKAYFEAFAENPFLESYYEDMKRWGLHSQLFFMVQAIQQHMSIVSSRRGSVQDRSIYEHYEVFVHNLRAQGILDDRDFAMLTELYASVQQLLQPPDLLVFVDVPAEETHRRISERGRDMERSISLEYLENFDKRYHEFVAGWDQSPVLTVDGLRYDVRRNEDLEEVCDQVIAKLGSPDTRIA